MNPYATIEIQKQGRKGSVLASSPIQIITLKGGYEILSPLGIRFVNLKTVTPDKVVASLSAESLHIAMYSIDWRASCNFDRLLLHRDVDSFAEGINMHRLCMRCSV